MKSTEKSIDSSADQGVIVRATPNQILEIVKALGAWHRFDNYGDEDTNLETEFQTDDGDIFTVYDWNEKRCLMMDETYDFHIGAHSKRVANKAQSEMYKEIKKTKS